MKHLLAAILFAIVPVSVPVAAQAADSTGLISRVSPYPVTETLDCLEAVLKSKGVKIFARIDHAAEAQGAGMSLRQTQLLIFGGSGHYWLLAPMVVIGGAIGAFVASRVQMTQMPELVAGFHTEYSAFKFGMFFMGEYANIIAASGLVVTLYFGGWSLPGIAFSGVWGALASIAVFFAKTLAFIALFIWVRWTLPRFRYDQLMDLGWKVLLPLSFLHLIVVAAVVAAK